MFILILPTFLAFFSPSETTKSSTCSDRPEVATLSPETSQDEDPANFWASFPPSSGFPLQHAIELSDRRCPVRGVQRNSSPEPEKQLSGAHRASARRAARKQATLHQDSLATSMADCLPNPRGSLSLRAN